jgi:NADH-quinone oxidoreductase subunit N
MYTEGCIYFLIFILIARTCFGTLVFDEYYLGSKFLFNFLVLFDFNSIILKFIILFLFLFFLYFNKLQTKLGVFETLVKERPFLLLLNLFFIFFLTVAADLNIIYICFEALTFFIAIIISFGFNKLAIDSAIKYFSLSVVSSGFFILGTSLIYGSVFVTDFFHLKLFFTFYKFQISLDYILVGLFFILISFLFKLSAYPGNL